MRSGVLVLWIVVVLAVGLLVLASRSDDGASIGWPSLEELEQLSYQADTACRGGHGDDVSTWEACDVRAAFTLDLHQRGQCLTYEEQWLDCPTDFDSARDARICSSPVEPEVVAVEDVPCIEASDVVAQAGAVSTEPTRIDRFTCVASGATAPRAVWCGDYGIDLTIDRTTPGAIVWREQS